MFVELIQTQGKRNVLHINGHLYNYRGNGRNDQIWWNCVKDKQCGCLAQAVTVHSGTSIFVLLGPYESPHIHAPDFSEIFARKAETNDYENIGKPCEPPSCSHVTMVSENGRYKKQHFKRCPELYRAFLQHFSKDPTFNKKSIYKSLKFVLKSYSAIATSYNDIMECEGKVRLDLETLRKNPNAAFDPLDEEYRVYQENRARHVGSSRKNVSKSDVKQPRGTIRGQTLPPCPAAIPISWVRLERSLIPLVIDLTEKSPAAGESTDEEDSSRRDEAGSENGSESITTSIVLDKPDDCVYRNYTQNRPVYNSTRLPVLWIDRHSDAQTRTKARL